MRFEDAQVNLYVADIDNVLAFYTAIGFSENFRAPADGPSEHVEVGLGGLTLGITRADVVGAVHGQMPLLGNPQAEVVVWCDDVDRAFAYACEKGAPQIRSPGNFGGRLRMAWVRDPAGNPVKFVAKLTG
ncbi:MAG: VOC family protein [Rhizobiaceae bacterium]